MTLAAEHEAAQANLAGSKAGRELKAAEDAELAVRKAQQKHREVSCPVTPSPVQQDS